MTNYKTFVFLTKPCCFTSALQCHETINNPENGILLCPNGQTIGSNCSIECDAGHELAGKPVLTCLPDRSWSDQLPSCQLLQCEESSLLIPPNTFIMLPCSNDYNSACNIRCFAGFTLNGTGKISCELNESGNVQWISDGTYCQSENFFSNFNLIHVTVSLICHKFLFLRKWSLYS